MNTEDLYRQSPCPQCGQPIFDSVSFCAHCGYAKKQRRWEDTLSRRRGGGEGAPKGSGFSISVLLGLGFAAYLIYRAVTGESLQNFIVAMLVLFSVLHSWLSARKKARQLPDAGEQEKDTATDPADDPLGQKFFCENCGTRVAEDASQCPKCGWKFA